MSNSNSPTDIGYCNVTPPPCIEWPPYPPTPIEQAVQVPAIGSFGLVGVALVVIAVAIRKFRRTT